MSAEPNVCGCEKEKLQIEHEKLLVEKDKLALEKSFAKKWAAPILGLAGVIVASLFSAAAVWITSDIGKRSNDALLQLTKQNNNNEEQNREMRWKLDFANFLVNNWRTIIKTGDEKDLQAVIEISQLFPIYASNAITTVLEMGKDNIKIDVLKAALKSVKPTQDLTGNWQCMNKCQPATTQASIDQRDINGQISINLIVTNEVGQKSRAIYTTPKEFLAIEPGDLRAFVQDKDTINWANGSIWKRAQQK